MSLSGKHALITGRSRGIGRGIAVKLADHGVNVAVHKLTLNHSIARVLPVIVGVAWAAKLSPIAQ